VAASFAVGRLDGFLVRSQAHLKFTREAELCVLSKAIRRAMHDQDRHVELRGAIPGSESVARRMKNSGLHIPARQIDRQIAYTLIDVLPNAVLEFRTLTLQMLLPSGADAVRTSVVPFGISNLPPMTFLVRGQAAVAVRS
jgi:hypothetical protein